MKELNKVAEITLLFWLIKSSATTLGAEISDFIERSLGIRPLSVIFSPSLYQKED